MIADYSKYLKERLKQAPDRVKEVQKAVSSLEKRKYALDEHKDVIRREFLGAVQRYLFGFYEDAVYHSCFAAEYALLHLLTENLNAGEKVQIHGRMNRPLNEKTVKVNYARKTTERMLEGKIVSPNQKSETERVLLEELKKQEIQIRTEIPFGFRQIIRECKRIGLIDETTSDLANQLNDIRDTHLHPQNFISALISQYRNFLKMPGITQSLFYRMVPGMKTIVTMPDYSWAAKDTVRERVEKQVEQYFEEIRVKMRKFQIKELLEMVGYDYYFRRIAQQSLDLSFQVLTRTGFY
jgi:hypothetical protein